MPFTTAADGRIGYDDPAAAARASGDAQIAATRLNGQYGLQGEQLRDKSQQAVAGIQAGASEYGANAALQGALAPVNLKSQEFGQLFPLLSGYLGKLTGPGGATHWLGQAPDLPSSTVLNGQQQQQLVNQNVSANDAQAQTNNRQIQQQAAGRGFGNNSPLVASLQGQQNAQAMAQNAQARSNIPIQVAQQNAQQALGVGNLSTQQYAAQLDAMNRQQNAIVAALAGLL